MLFRTNHGFPVYFALAFELCSCYACAHCSTFTTSHLIPFTIQIPLTHSRSAFVIIMIMAKSLVSSTTGKRKGATFQTARARLILEAGARQFVPVTARNITLTIIHRKNISLSLMIITVICMMITFFSSEALIYSATKIQI